MSVSRRHSLNSAPARPDLDALIKATFMLMTPAEIREQRISFVYGNCSLDNPDITREMVVRAYDEMYGKPK